MEAGASKEFLTRAVWDRGSFLPSYTPDRFATHWQSFHLFVKDASNASRTFFSPSLSVIKAAQHATDSKAEFEFTVCDEPAGARRFSHTKATNAMCSVIKRHR
jgi:hypothetical protein